MDLRLTGDDHSRAAASALAEVAPVAFAVEAGLADGACGLDELREVGAEDDPVRRGDRTDLQGREEQRAGGAAQGSGA